MDAMGNGFGHFVGRISRISQHYGSSHLPGDIMEKHLGDPLETTWTIRIVATLWITLDYYYDNPKQFANVKAIKANLNQFSPCRTGMEDRQKMCWFYRTPHQNKESSQKYSPWKKTIEQWESNTSPSSRFINLNQDIFLGWNPFPFHYLLIAGVRIQIKLIHSQVVFEVME